MCFSDWNISRKALLNDFEQAVSSVSSQVILNAWECQPHRATPEQRGARGRVSKEQRVWLSKKRFRNQDWITQNTTKGSKERHYFLWRKYWWSTVCAGRWGQQYWWVNLPLKDTFKFFFSITWFKWHQIRKQKDIKKHENSYYSRQHVVMKINAKRK